MSKRIALFAGAAALVLSAAALPVLAQPAPGAELGRPGEQGRPGEPGRHGPGRGGFAMGEAFARADANNDGKVTQEEGWAWLSARFQEVDADRDGGMTIDEMRAFAQSHMGRRSPPARAEQHGQAMFRAVDSNGDGKVTLEEIRPFAEAMFRARDANADGALSREEIRPARMRGGHRGEHRPTPPAPQSN